MLRSTESFKKLLCKVPRQSFRRSIRLGVLIRSALEQTLFPRGSTRVIPYNTQLFVAGTSTLLLHGHVCIYVMS